MQNYQNIAESIQKLKKPLMLIAGVSVFLNLVVLGAGVIINSKTESKRFTTFESCHNGMKSIFEHNGTEDLIHSKVLKDLEKHHFDIEEITLIKVRNGLHCDVVARDSKGYRSYSVTLEKNAKYPHLYRIFDVRGQKIVSAYQWKEIVGGTQGSSR